MQEVRLILGVAVILLAGCGPAERIGTVDSGQGPTAGRSDAGAARGTLDAGNASVDAGDAGMDGSVDAVDAGEDAGPPDAAVPMTVFYTDAGVTIVRYDLDAGGDCDGILPSPDQVSLVTRTFPSQASGCAPPMSDESGVIALGTGGAPPIGEYTLVTNDADAGYLATFAPGIPWEALHSEKAGFSSAILDGGWSLAVYGHRGEPLGSATRALQPGDIGEITQWPSGGYALVVGEAASARTVLQSFTPASQWQLTDSVVLGASADGGIYRARVQASWEGNLFVERLASYPEIPSLPNRWYTPAGKPLTDPFDGYGKTVPGTFTALGGVVFEVDNSLDGAFPYYYWFLADPTAAPTPRPPNPFLKLAIVRHGRAYANWGTICFWNGTCRHEEDQMDLYARSGAQCGSLIFTPTGKNFVGRDGTVIQQAGCSYRWYPQLLK